MQDETTQATHNEPSAKPAGGEPAQDETAVAISADVNAVWSRHMREYRAAAAELRASCLAHLRRLGVERVEADYSGHADSGSVDDIRLEPEPATMPEGLPARLDELVWRTAYLVSPGFEINDGGSGTLYWRIGDDDITIDHCTYYTAEDHSRHENL